MNSQIQSKNREHKLIYENPLDKFKIIEQLDQEGSMLLVKRYSDMRQFFAFVDKFLDNETILNLRLKDFERVKNFLVRSKIEDVLMPDSILICGGDTENGKRAIWRLYEPFDYVLWNQYYIGGFKLRRKFVVRHFNEEEMLLISQGLISTVILFFAKGQLPSFNHFFVCVQGNRYRLFFENFKDVRTNPTLAFVDYDIDKRVISIKKVIHDKSKVFKSEKDQWEFQVKERRQSRRNNRRSLKQKKLASRKVFRERRVKSMKQGQSPMSPLVQQKIFSDVSLFGDVKEAPPDGFVERRSKRYWHSREGLKRNLFSSFFITKFENLVDFSMIIIYGFLKDVVFAYYDIRVRDTDSLMELYKDSKLARFDNLLTIFFYMLDKVSYGSIPSFESHLPSKSSLKNLNSNNGQSCSKGVQSELTSTGNKSQRERKVCLDFMSNVQKRRNKTLGKLDKFENDCSTCLKKFLRSPFEFRNIKCSSLSYPIFRYLVDLNLVFNNSNFGADGEFDRLAEVFRNLKDVKRLTLVLSK